MESLFLIVSIAGRRVAMPASAVESVVEIDEITPVPLVAPHIAGLFALRSRVLTIVDSLASLEQPAAARARQAVIVNCDGQAYGLLVDHVDDVVSIAARPQPSRAPLGRGWARVALGLVEHGDELLLLIDPAALVAGPMAIAA